MNKRVLMAMMIFTLLVSACQASENGSMESDETFPNRDALPNESGIEGVQTFPDRTEYHGHIKEVPESTDSIPPSFGAHFSAWQNCGIYDQPIALGNALHSMEHGAVWLTYAPDLSAEQVNALRDVVRGNAFALMSPYEQQSNPVVLTAWTVQLVIDTLPDARIAQFVSYYANGPQNPEPGAPCSGAFGTPIE